MDSGAIMLSLQSMRINTTNYVKYTRLLKADKVRSLNQVVETVAYHHTITPLGVKNCQGICEELLQSEDYQESGTHFKLKQKVTPCTI